MSEWSQMLNRKMSELEAAVEEAQSELARADASRRAAAHRELADALRQARAWLDARKEAPEGAGGDEQAAAAEARHAEGLMHEIRLRRSEI